jgi:acetyltransferase-like isoleucine patch superfamily enzyme
MFRICCLVLVLPVWLAYRIIRLFSGHASFYGFSQLLSLFPGITGNYLRYAFYSLTLSKFGENACVCFMATLSHPDTEIGAHAYIGPFVNLGLCSIGDHTLLGNGVHVMSGFSQHHFSDLHRPIQEQGGTLTKVKVGEDCWIGNRAIIGADIGLKSIVGAGSLVHKPIPEFSIAYGNPAKVVRDRRENSSPNETKSSP